MRDGLLNFHKDGLGVLGGSGANHRPDGLGDAALLADDLAHILGRYVKLQNRRFRPDGLLNVTASLLSTSDRATYSTSSFMRLSPR